MIKYRLNFDTTSTIFYLILPASPPQLRPHRPTPSPTNPQQNHPTSPPYPSTTYPPRCRMPVRVVVPLLRTLITVSVLVVVLRK